MRHSQSKEPAPSASQDGYRDGTVVWDQNGVVVLWPDGHCSRFSWATLRQACQCSECQDLKETEF